MYFWFIIYDVEIVQPLFNPPAGWADKYIIHFEELKHLFDGKNVKIILVNDGSTENFGDETIKILREKITDIQVLSYKENKGKGFALRAGIKETQSKYVLYTDYDFPYKIQCLRSAYNELLKGNDIVIGIRSEDYYRKLSFFRTIISKSFVFVTKQILKIPFNDTQSGLKAFNSKGKELLLQTNVNRFLFDTELIYKAQKNKNVKISTIKLELNEDVKFTQMNISILLQEMKNLFWIMFRK